MPANLTPEYRAAEARFRAAVTREEKIATLEEMLRVIPKHKGTDKLQGDLRSRLSKLKHEPKRKGATRGHSHKIPHEGAGQVVLVGAPNAGKSSLVAALTHAQPEVAVYPLTTREATPGMMPYEDIAFQLVDLPPICEEHVEPWVYDLVRAGDLAWLVVSIERPLAGHDLVLELLGIASVHTILDLMRWNRYGHVAKSDGWERAPVGWAWVAAIAYLVAVVLLLVVLEAAPKAAPFAPVLFPFVAVAGAILLGVIGQHDDRKRRYSLGNDLKRKPDEAENETERTTRRHKSFVCPICGARYQTQNGLNGHMNAHKRKASE